MKLRIVGLAPLALLLASTGANAANPILFAQGNTMGGPPYYGELQLGDPATLIGGDTTTIVETGLDDNGLDGGRGIIAATISGTTASNIHVARHAYVKGGMIFTINLSPAASHMPAQVSNVVDACGLEADLANFQSTRNSWLMVRRAGADLQCDTGDDVRSGVRLSMGAAAAPRTPVNLSHMDAIYDTTGNIAGFVTVEGNNLKHRDADFNNPTMILALANNSVSRHAQMANAMWYALTPKGQTATQLYRYDEVANSNNQVTGPLHSFSGSPNVDGGFADGTDFYFADGGDVMRIGVDSTVDGASVLTTAPGSATPDRLFVSTNYVFFQAHTPAYDLNNVYSVPKTGNPTPTTLVVGNIAQGNFPQLVVAADDFAYVTVQTANGGKAVRISGDGSASTTALSAYWGGFVAPSSFDWSRGSDPTRIAQWLIRVSRNKSAATDTLKLFNPSTGYVGRTLGSITSIDVGAFPAVNAFGVGRYVGASAVIARDSFNYHYDKDAFVFDVNTADSLTPVITNKVSDDVPLDGN